MSRIGWIVLLSLALSACGGEGMPSVSTAPTAALNTATPVTQGSSPSFAGGPYSVQGTVLAVGGSVVPASAVNAFVLLPDGSGYSYWWRNGPLHVDTAGTICWPISPYLIF